jgi:hypothetical protein
MAVPVGLETDIKNAHEHGQRGKKILNTNETYFTFGAVMRPLYDILVEVKSPKVIYFLFLL